MRQEHRAPSVAFVTGTFSVCLILGPTIGGFLDANMAVYSCISLTCVALAYVVLLIPESAPRFRSGKIPADFGVVGLECGQRNEEEGGSLRQDQKGIKAGVGEDEATLLLSSKEMDVGAVSMTPPADVNILVKTLEASGKGGPEKDVDNKPELGQSSQPSSPSLSPLAETTSPSCPPSSSPVRSLSRGWMILLKSQWYLKLALIWALVGAASNGSQVWITGVIADLLPYEVFLSSSSPSPTSTHSHLLLSY